MDRIRRWVTVALILVFCVGCDQATKAMARTYLSAFPPQSYLGDLFRFQYSENPGAFLNLGAGLSPAMRFWLFTLLIAGFLAGLLVYLLRNDKLDRTILGSVALSLPAGLEYAERFSRTETQDAGYQRDALPD